MYVMDVLVARNKTIRSDTKRFDAKGRLTVDTFHVLISVSQFCVICSVLRLYLMRLSCVISACQK